VLRKLALALLLLLAAGQLGGGTPGVRPALACWKGMICDTAVDPPVFSGYPRVTDRLLEFDGHAYVYQPGRAAYEGGHGQFSQIRTPAPVVGADCKVWWVAPVQWHKDAVTGDIWASFDAPPGGYEPALGDTAGTRTGPPLNVAEEKINATLMGANVTTYRWGVYALNPDRSITCHLDSLELWFQPQPCNQLARTYDICYNWVPRTVVGGPNAVNWGPYAADVANSLKGQAGQIVSSPSSRGVVNTATCFWVEGMGIPNSIDRLLYLAGPPDAYGRQIFYTFIIHAAFNGISWDYDDPAGNAPATPAGACGDTSAHPHLTAHEYSTVSEGRHPDNRYQVTAHESYVISVDEYWYDQNGFNHVQPVPPIPEQVISTDPYPQYVVQVEGVPQS
jgi:hypothetical protein